MPMQKRHFDIIASAFKRTRTKANLDSETVLTFASVLADTLAETNPRFNRDQFMVACGLVTATGQSTWERPRRPTFEPRRRPRVYRV